MILIKVVASKEVKKDDKTYYPAQVLVKQDDDVLGVGTYFLDRKYDEGLYEPVFSYFKGRFSPHALRAVASEQSPI